jgi:hypothetical protein
MRAARKAGGPRHGRPETRAVREAGGKRRGRPETRAVKDEVGQRPATNAADCPTSFTFILPSRPDRLTGRW